MEYFNCWWCCYKFNTEPVFLPFKYNNNIFTVKGNFCSFNCCLSYNHNHTENYYETESLIYLFYKKMNDISFDKIKINYAPPKEILQKFGGPIDIDDYRQHFSVKQYNIFYPPYTSVIPELEEVNLFTAKEITKEEKETQQLVLKRHKKDNKNIDDFFS